MAREEATCGAFAAASAAFAGGVGFPAAGGDPAARAAASMSARTIAPEV